MLDATVVAPDLQVTESDTANALCALAVDLLHADAVGITAVAGGRCRTVGGTGRRPADVDAIQFGLGEGPSLSAMSTVTTYRSDDLATDRRWPTFGRRAVERTGLHSMMALPAVVGGRLVGTLAVYAVRTGAFDDAAQATGTVICSHASMALASKDAETRRKQLAAVLGRSRRIGTAVGILMTERRWSDSQAYEAMALEATWRHTRDRTSRIVDVADDVIRDRRLQRPTS